MLRADIVCPVFDLKVSRSRFYAALAEDGGVAAAICDARLEAAYRRRSGRAALKMANRALTDVWPGLWDVWSLPRDAALF
jgi:hypothetical protein